MEEELKQEIDDGTQFENQYVKLIEDASNVFEVEGEVIPIQFLSDSFNQYLSRIFELSLVSCYITTNDCKTIATSYVFKFLTKLDLSNNNIGTEGLLNLTDSKTSII